MKFKVFINERTVGKKILDDIEKWLKDDGREYRTEFFMGKNVVFQASKKELKQFGVWDESYNPSIHI